MAFLLSGVVFRRGYRYDISPSSSDDPDDIESLYFVGNLITPRKKVCRVFAVECGEELGSYEVRERHVRFVGIEGNIVNDSKLEGKRDKNAAGRTEEEKKFRQEIKQVEDEFLKPKGEAAYLEVENFGLMLSMPDFDQPTVVHSTFTSPVKSVAETAREAEAKGEENAKKEEKKAVDKLIESPPKYEAKNLKQYRENLLQYQSLAALSSLPGELVIYYLKTKSGIPEEKFPPAAAYAIGTGEDKLNTFIDLLMVNCSPNEQEMLGAALKKFFEGEGIMAVKDSKAWLTEKEKQRAELEGLNIKFDEKTFGGIVLYLARLTPEAAVAVYGWIKGDLNYQASVRPALSSVVAASGTVVSQNPTALVVPNVKKAAAFNGYCNYAPCGKWGHKAEDCFTRRAHEKEAPRKKGDTAKGKGKKGKKGKDAK
jgi:hypothetical protein